MKLLPILLAASLSPISLHAQLGLGARKMLLERMLPPAVELDARSVSISASSQDPAGREVAASFKEMFRGKIQGDSRFPIKDSDPELRISIVVTRYYVEPKQLARTGKNALVCTTSLGNLQGTFSIVDAKTGHPQASDVIGWKLQVGLTKHWLVGDDGSQMNIAGPREKLTLGAAFSFVGEEGGSGLNPLNRFGRQPHPCDLPFTQNETRDVLADAFLTDLVRLAVPHKIPVEVPLPGGKLKKMSEDLAAGRGENAGQEAEKLGQQSKLEEEAERQYLIGLTNEAAGYKLGGQIFEARQKIKRDTPPDEVAKIQSEIKRMVDQAKERFDMAAVQFKRSGDSKDEKHYRDAERRAEQSQRLYARIKRYRELKPAADEPIKPVGLSMSDIVNLCNQGLESVIIVDRIEQAPVLAATREEVSELAKCGPRQTDIFKALKGRWDAKIATPPAAIAAPAPLPAAVEVQAPPASVAPVKPVTGPNPAGTKSGSPVPPRRPVGPAPGVSAPKSVVK